MLADKYLLFTAWNSILKWFSFCSWRSLSSTSLSLTSTLSLISTTQWLHISQYQNLGLQHVQQASQTGSSQAAFGLCDFLWWLGNLEEVEQYCWYSDIVTCRLHGSGLNAVRDRTCQDWLWGLPCILFSGYQCFSSGTWPGHEVNHSPPSTVKDKNEWSCTSSFHICLHSLDREKFTFLRLFEWAHKMGCHISKRNICFRKLKDVSYVCLIC